MACVAPAQVDVGAGFVKDVGQVLCVIRRDHAVHAPCSQEDGHPREIGRQIGLERNHCPEQDRGLKQTGVQQDRARRHVGPIGVAYGDEFRAVDTVLC